MCYADCRLQGAEKGFCGVSLLEQLSHSESSHFFRNVKEITLLLLLLLLLLLYIQLTISCLIGWKRTVNFQNQCLGCHVAADCTIIMSRSLKVMGNHQSGGYLLSSFEARPINTIFSIDVFIKVLCIQYRSGSQEF